MPDAVSAFDGSAPAGVPAWEWDRDLCAPFVDLLPVSGASISVFGRGGNPSTVCVSDALAARLDTMQFELGEGPRWEAARTGRRVISADVMRDPHPDWPVFGARAAALDVGALFAFPIKTGPVMMGVVDLYRRTPGILDVAATTRALSLARRVVVPAVQEALRSAEMHSGDETARAPALRREVHQAAGMVFVQLGVTIDEALALLRAYAFTHDRALDDVARDVVNRIVDFRHLPD